MTYTDAVKWAELEAAIRARMKSAPRGYQKKLAEKLNVTPGYVNHIATGHRPVPVEHIDVILETLELELDLKEKGGDK